MNGLQAYMSTYKNLILTLSVLAITSTSLLLLALLRLAQILPTPASTHNSKDNDFKPTSTPRPLPSPSNPTHFLIVLGSGGHTAEMLNILTSIPNLPQTFTRRTYLVSSGDSFSALKAVEFEKTYISQPPKEQTPNTTYHIVTVRRARRVHQSFLSTPLTALLSLWDCVTVLRGTHPDTKTGGSEQQHTYPDLIMTNGPGTGVCVVIAALLLRFFGFGGPPAITDLSRSYEVKTYVGKGQMRTIFIESWARVKTLSLSGKILRPIVNRFLVQWPQLAEILGEGVEYIGPLVS